MPGAGLGHFPLSLCRAEASQQGRCQELPERVPAERLLVPGKASRHGTWDRRPLSATSLGSGHQRTPAPSPEMGQVLHPDPWWEKDPSTGRPWPSSLVRQR